MAYLSFNSIILGIRVQVSLILPLFIQLYLHTQSFLVSCLRRIIIYLTLVILILEDLMTKKRMDELDSRL